MEENFLIEELPCKLSDISWAKNLKRRSISAVCQLPLGYSCSTLSQDSYSCDQAEPLDVSVTPNKLDEELEGKIPPVQQLDEQNSYSSHKAGASIKKGHTGQSLVAEGHNGKSVRDNDGAWWMMSKVYPPPKRRSVFAKRRYPEGCGRNLGSIVAGFDSIQIQHEKMNGMNEAVLGKEAEAVSTHVGGTNENSKEAGEAGLKCSVNDAGIRNSEGFRTKRMSFESDTAKLVRDSEDGEVSPSVMAKQVERVARMEKTRKVEGQEINGKVFICAELDTFNRKGVNVDNNSGSSQHKVMKPTEVKKTSKVTIPFSKCPSEKTKARTVSRSQLTIKTSPMKVTSKKRVGIKRLASKSTSSLPNIDRSALGDVDMEEYASRVMLHCKKSVSAFGHTSPAKFRKTVAKKSIPQSRGCSSRLNEYQPNTAYIGLKKDNRLTDPRLKVKRCLRLFQIIFRKLLQEIEAGNKPAERRIDLRTACIMGDLNETLCRDVVGSVPGVEVGDEYRYRAELSVLGLHRPPQAGIHSIVQGGIRIATSIVASGGYTDDMENENVLIYTGAGGKPTGKPGHTLPEDQKLERGNLALKNSIDTKTPVRVIHGQNIGDSAKVIMSYTYDGLYKVEEYWRDKETYVVKGVQMTVAVFRFRLRRLEGQPELNWSKLKKVQRSKAREGLCFKDISLGQEKLPICVINTVDNVKLRQFQYITKLVYPSWYQKRRPKGCNCKGPCSDVMTCSCAAKNGGRIPFNFNGAIVQAKQLIYECGPMCGCPPSCYNRVSQHGIKIPLEVFKTERRGWGVRSLCSIPSGSFVCEYVGELLLDQDAEQKKNDEYLFDIGHNYDDSILWEGLPTDVPGIGIMLPITDKGINLLEGSDQEGFTIDALKMGNVGRFINHSCSPNLYAQNVLYDHDDKKMPHIMFFAAENIPPLKELTYHYNYTIGSVHDSDGNVKVKECYCGSSECKGRLY